MLVYIDHLLEKSLTLQLQEMQDVETDSLLFLQ